MTLRVWFVLICAALGFIPFTAGRAQEMPPFVQAGLNAVFVVEGERVTALYSFSYVEPADEVRWVLPLPPDARAIHQEAALLPALAQAWTDPEIEPPYQRAGLDCGLSVQWVFGEGVVPGPNSLLPDAADLQVFEAAQRAEVFLSAGGWNLSQEQRQVLARYAGQGYRFAALTLRPDADAPEADAFWTSINVHLSPTVIVEYEGADPILPLAFRTESVAAHLDNYDRAGALPVTATIFADSPYAPAGTNRFQPDLSRIGGARSQLANTMRLVEGDPIFFNALDPAYYALLLQGMAAGDGRTFTVEMIGKPAAIHWDGQTPEAMQGIAAFNRLAADHAVLSRWRTFLTGEAAAVEAVTFNPDPSLAPFRMALAEVVDPAWFFGCTSRKLVDPALEERLPAGRAHLDDLRLSLAHPIDWSLSRLDAADRRVYALSPAPVTWETLAALREDHAGPPVLVIEGVEQDFSQTGVAEQYRSGMLPPPEDPAACAGRAFYQPSPHAVPVGDMLPTAPLKSVRLTLLTSPEDCATSAALYDDMLHYAASYQYFLSAELRHTLFIGELYQLIGIAYPDGWIETLDAERNRLILPEGGVYAFTPAVRVLPEDDPDAAARVAAAGFSDASELPTNAVAAFTANGRQGYIRRTNNRRAALIEFSAPAAQFAETSDLLRRMAEAVWVAEPPG
ncbi:MAG: DUF2330 domain-containing protein [Anaerolineae bacterium]|nr:DUF2330 domain-containing protein [Anaerolineae bacterium]NUQ04542.1 DUF2330 domain-containing protein [Anaerolineae bacterium]